MVFGVGSYGVGFLAGLLSTLSPCVLPIIPILVATATDVHPRAPLALAGGLALSYGVIGTALAWAGSALAVDTSVVRNIGAVLLGLLGLVLVSAPLQQRIAMATSGIGAAGQHWLSRIRPDGLRGQFAVGLVLGIVWSPCVGPTLGAALLLASRGTQLPQVAALMGVFGLGAALPVVAFGAVGRATIARMRGRLAQAGAAAKMILGTAMLALALLILTGADRAAESWLLDRFPPWLTDLSTRY